jgi:hypothetical protein
MTISVVCLPLEICSTHKENSGCNTSEYESGICNTYKENYKYVQIFYWNTSTEVTA